MGQQRLAERGGEGTGMDNTCCHHKGYALAAGLGAIGGGLVVVLATKAIPKMMSQMMRRMMEQMMAKMGDGGCDPAET